MTATKLDQFGGMLPAWDDHLLPAGQAASSVNAYLFSGALIGWRAPKLLRNLLNSSAKMVFRVPTVTSAVALSYLVGVANANEGDTVKLGEETYRITAAVSLPYDVLLGGSASATLANLFLAFTLTGTLGVTYGTGTCVNTAINIATSAQTTNNFGAGVVPVLQMNAPDTGAAFNVTVVAESTGHARLAWVSGLGALSYTTTFSGGVNATFDSTITSLAATWLEFLDPDTNVMRSPTVNDQFGRYYFASPSLPPEYNTTPRIQAGQPPFQLGVPPPGCNPGVTPTGGGNVALLGFNTSSTGNSYAPGSNVLILTQVNPSGAMNLNDISMMPAATNPVALFAGVVYADNNGQPGALLNTGAIVQGCVSGTAVVSSFVNPTGLLINTPYWIGIIMDSNVAIQQATNVIGSFEIASNTFGNGPPQAAPGMSGGIPQLQIWGDLTTSSVLEARAYVYTWVSAYQEEGPPSPPTIVTGWTNAAWTIDLFTPTTDDQGVIRNLQFARVYRTVPGTNGQTVFYWVCDVNLSSGAVVQSNNIQGSGDGQGNVVAVTGGIVDTMDSSVIALNTQLPSSLWFPPPEGLQGILSMPNGIAVGFKANEVWFSEAYLPHAWPPGYVLTTEFPVVGIGINGQSAIICTAKTPYIATGVNPASMSLTKIEFPEPCISRGSVLSTDNGVYYCSPNGLILVKQDGTATNTTELWITRERWRSLTPSKNVRAVMLVSSYFAFGSTAGADVSVAQKGFTIELSQDNASFTIWPQPGGHRLGFNGLTAPGLFNVDNVLIDSWTGTGLLVQNGSVYYYDFADAAPTITPYTWRSKKFQQTTKRNFEVVKIYFSVPPGTPAQNAVRNQSATLDASWNALTPGQYGILRVFADDVLVTTREIRTSAELLRILSGFKADTWQFEVTSIMNISNIQVATSVKDLATV